ncbi:MAG: glycosyltransferase family 9 protein [Fimbriimonadaceae bacterium]
MPRYFGHGLPSNPRVAVIANDAIGNFVVSTPLLQMIRRELSPSFIHYYGGTRTLEMQAASDLFEWDYPLHGTPFGQACRDSRGPYDLVINVERTENAMGLAGFLETPETAICGPYVGKRGPEPYGTDDRAALWQDQNWIAEDLTEKYPFLQSGFIAEIFARLAYLEGPVPAYKVPTEAIQSGCDILIATSASLPEKLWPLSSWLEVLKALNDHGLTVGLIGAKPSAQREHWKGDSDEESMVACGLVRDLRGAFTLPQVVGALGACRLVLSLDNGILHLACAARQDGIVGLTRFGIHRLWTPKNPGLKVLTSEPGGMVSDIPVDVVLEACRQSWRDA